MAHVKCMVMFKDSAVKSDVDRHIEEVHLAGGQVGQIFDSLLKGFAATVPDFLYEKLQTLQGVGPIDYVELDQEMTTF